MEFRALEVWLVYTAVASSRAQNVGDYSRRAKLADLLEFSEAELRALGWQMGRQADGHEMPLFDVDATITRELSEKQKRLAVSIVSEMIGVFPMVSRRYLLSAMHKLGWTEEE